MGSDKRQGDGTIFFIEINSIPTEKGELFFNKEKSGGKTKWECRILTRCGDAFF